jgi:hypothetical protein
MQRRQRSLAGCVLRSALALVALAGCRNLDLPDVSDGGVPPTLRVAAPAPNARVSLQTLVSVESASVEGVASVVVSCGSDTLAGWAQPPFSGLVDLTRCQVAGLASDAGPGLVSITLTITSLSRTGRSTSVDVPVLLDRRVPALQVTYPPQAAPGSPIDVLVQPSEPLAAPPSVQIDGLTPDRVDVVADGGPLPGYLARFARLPGLGTDTYDGGQPIPIEVLSQTERAAHVRVDATSAGNGNSAHLDLSLLLSRVTWDRPAPGRLALPASDAVATAAGVQLPLATDDLVPTPGSRWIPGLLAAADGTFRPFDPALLPGGLDGGYRALGFSAGGSTVFASASSALWFPPAPTAAPAPVAFPAGAGTPLGRVGDATVCLPPVVGGTPSGSCFLAGATETLTCATSGGQLSFQSGFAFAPLAPPVPGGTLGSGSIALIPAAAGCSLPWGLGTPSGSLVFGSSADPDRPGCTLDSVRQAFAVGDGSFVVAFAGSCGGLPDFPVVRLSATGTILTGYVVPRTAAAPTALQGVAALPDGSWVTLRNAPPYTVLEQWAPGGTAPSARADIAGLYALVPGASPVTPRNAVVRSDGALTVLLSGGPNGSAVAHFAPGLVPRWLYFYPRTLVPSVDGPQLLGTPNSLTVYLLDPRNQRALALDTGPGTTATTAGIRVTGTVLGNIAAVPVAGERVVVRGAGFRAETVTDSAGSFTVDGVPVPYQVLLFIPGSQEPPYEALIYDGLTRPDPVLTNFAWYSNGNTAYVTGTLNSPLVTIQPSQLGAALFAVPGVGQWSQQNFGANWAVFIPLPGNTTTAAGTVYAYTALPDAGSPVFGSTSLTVDAGTSLSGLTIDVAPITNQTVTGTLQLPPGWASRTLAYLSAPGTPGAGLFVAENDNPSFSLAAPFGTGLDVVLMATAYDPNLGRVSLSAGTKVAAPGPVSITLPTAPTITFPVTGSGVDAGTVFRWSGQSGAVYLLEGGYRAAIVTAQPAVAFPDLTSEGFTFDNYNFCLTTYEGFASADAFAGGFVDLSQPVVRAVSVTCVSP